MGDKRFRSPSGTDRQGREAAETARVRRIWDREAPRYDRTMSFFERILFAGAREWACSRATGDVLEVAVGTGRNFPHYPPGASLTGFDLSPVMVALARAQADDFGLKATLEVADAQRLPYANGSFDSVVCTFSLCSIPNHVAAIREIGRVLRPRGTLLMVEHVRSPWRAIRLCQRVLEPLTVRLEGDHLTREPVDHLGAHGFVIESQVRLKWGIVERVVARNAWFKSAQPAISPTPVM